MQMLDLPKVFKTCYNTGITIYFFHNYNIILLSIMEGL